ncbi:MAG TPA: MotA/TolQ/ExbB proton channel family protein [Gemmataceae bacterium]|nr:MotA/TolQ/ExbB proton channel family protein [Gemmataceae bacterium]
MRTLFIRGILPIVFCIVPFLAAALVVLCIPRVALAFFVDHIGLMEILIIGGGVSLFLVQMAVSWLALVKRGTTSEAAVDRWLTNLAQAAEWFPMLGLIGTVAGILEAFATHTGSAIQPRLIAPAITATGAGLLMALINILPSWIVILGGDMIMLLSGKKPNTAEETP